MSASPRNVTWIRAAVALLYAAECGQGYSDLAPLAGHAVQIEPGLRPESPENGSFLGIRQ